MPIGNLTSHLRKINAGCPQGSVLGPLLALIYLNSLSIRLHKEVLLFANDTSWVPYTANTSLKVDMSTELVRSSTKFSNIALFPIINSMLATIELSPQTKEFVKII